jgi:hypothetical protein
VKSVDVADNGLTGTDIDESTLNVAGTPGPKGATGAQGAQGTAGATGATGPAGVDGSPDTGAQILAKLMGVDGSGSELDADQLDGQSSAAFAAANHTHSGGPGGSIVDGTITDDDISSSAAIAESKLNTQMGVMTGRINGVDGNIVLFGGATGFTSATPTESNVTTLSPNVPVTASGLTVKLTAAPGVGFIRLLILRENGTDTAVSCAIFDTATSCNSAGATEVIGPGSELSLEIVGGGGTTADALFGFRLR